MLFKKKKYVITQHLTRFHKDVKDYKLHDTTLNNEINKYLQHILCHQESNENEIYNKDLNSLDMKLLSSLHLSLETQYHLLNQTLQI